MTCPVRHFATPSEAAASRPSGSVRRSHRLRWCRYRRLGGGAVGPLGTRRRCRSGERSAADTSGDPFRPAQSAMLRSYDRLARIHRSAVTSEGGELCCRYTASPLNSPLCNRRRPRPRSCGSRRGRSSAPDASSACAPEPYRRPPSTMEQPSRSSRDLESLSEHGLLRPGDMHELSALDLVRRFREQIDADMAWATVRRRRFRRRASAIKVASFALTSSRVVLGLRQTSTWASIALGMAGLVTVLNAVEPFANWRSCWVSMEDAQYKLNRLRDEIDFYLLSTRSDDITDEKSRELFDQWQQVWSGVSRQWLQFRRADGGGTT